jgi:shikimate kinase
MNWSYLHHGMVVWLEVPLALLEQRLTGDMGRPLLQTSHWQTTLQHLLEQRHALYAQADVQVSVAANEGVEEIVGRILDQIQERIRPETDSPVAN